MNKWLSRGMNFLSYNLVFWGPLKSAKTPAGTSLTAKLLIFPEYLHAWWRNQIETFSALLVLCARNSPVTGEFPAQRPVTWALMFSSTCAWINGLVNNREAGDLRRHHAHDDVIVMWALTISNAFRWPWTLQVPVPYINRIRTWSSMCLQIP